MNTKEEARKHFKGVAKALENIDLLEVEDAIDMLRTAKENKGNVWVVGNGGSAATAEHFANDLLKMARIKSIALPGMVPTITAFGNDDGWENMFKHPLLTLHGPNDVLVAISCSGNSPNVYEVAHWWFDDLIVLTGNERIKNKLANISQNPIIHVDSDDITIQEDVHLAVCHAIAKALRE